MLAVECFDDYSSVQHDEYLALLESRGRQVLDQKTEYISFSSLIDTSASLKYQKGLDVGDRVTCINQRWKVQIESRTTEITESYESGRMELEVTFGESIPFLREALKWRYSPLKNTTNLRSFCLPPASPSFSVAAGYALLLLLVGKQNPRKFYGVFEWIIVRRSRESPLKPR